jgi:nucleotide-binding universal stress UspA family protein
MDSQEGAPMKILIAYDGSPSADAAVDIVAKRPWPEPTEVRVVTVLEIPLFYPLANGIEVYPPLSEKVRQAMRQSAQAGAQGVVDKLKSRPGLKATCELREGDVKRSLLDAIKEWRADLVVVGSHGKGAIGRLFLGSVSHALVTHAPCDVEVVRPKVAG